MKRLLTAVGAGALVLALGACGQAQSNDTAANPPQVDPVNTIVVTPQGSDRAVPDAKIDASKLPAGYPKKAWTDDNGAVLTVQGQEGGCEQVMAELADQGPAAVHITLVRSLAGTNRPCTRELRIKKLTVQLAKPLSDRTVVLQQRTVWS